MNRKRITLIDEYVDAVYGRNERRQMTIEKWKTVAEDLLKQRNNLIEMHIHKQQKENEKVQD